jgi:hypothetical protein
MMRVATSALRSNGRSHADEDGNAAVRKMHEFEVRPRGSRDARNGSSEPGERRDSIFDELMAHEFMEQFTFDYAGLTDAGRRWMLATSGRRSL